jgi:signal transduction histidine kinase
MTPVESTLARAGVNVDALELLVEVLSQAESVSSGDAFYGHMCDAVCRLVRMRRSVIFRYDSSARRVRAAGAHGLDLDRFAGAHVTVESAEMAARALKNDAVVQATGDVRELFPPEFRSVFTAPVHIVCVPMAAAGRQIGVILADREPEAAPLLDAERDLLWTLGKAVALASTTRILATQAETARQLQSRIDLAREIHEGVMQRLFGVSMALDGNGDLPHAARARCAEETQAALGELRAALQRPLGRRPRVTGTTFISEVERLAHTHPDLAIRLDSGVEGDVPAAIEPLAQSVLIEAVRNARRHAHPRYVSVRVQQAGDAVVVEIVNDGVHARRRRAGMGLRLAALEALQFGGVVEFGLRDPATWQVRLVVPLDG